MGELGRWPVWLLLLWCGAAGAQQRYPIAEAWARTKVNAVIFRRNAVCSYGELQVAAFYDPQGRVVLARRKHGTGDWEMTITPLTGRTADAHNSISIAFDGEGYLHVSWDHHGNRLRYCRSVAPLSLELGPQEPMVGAEEGRVTYPEFYGLPGGELLFFYRDGSSGNGNLVLNRYDVRTRVWRRVHSNLIDGEGKRNAYWQAAIDRQGEVHLSWVWRETGDVTTNHDIAYAKSADCGVTWQKTTGETYSLPIDEARAEYAVRIPQNSELANQTSMAIDYWGRPYIANFWRDEPGAVPQYRLVMHDGAKWQTRQVGQRTLDFHRKGGGTKRPPISRPLLLLDSNEQRTQAYVLFRDQERGAKISVAKTSDPWSGDWTFTDLTAESTGQSDPMIDPDVWQGRKEIHLLTQFVGQGDGEKEEEVPPQTIAVVEWTPRLP
jgi:hypothetical protein